MTEQPNANVESKKTVTVVTQGQTVEVSPLLAETLRNAREAEAEAKARKGKGKGKNGNGNGQNHKGNNDKPAPKQMIAEKPVADTRTVDLAQQIKDKAKEERQAERQAEADKMAADTLAAFSDPDLEALIASAQEEAEEQFTVLTHALKVREQANLLKLAMDAAKAQFEKKFENEYLWVRNMRADLRKNSIAPNSPLALQVTKVDSTLTKLQEEAVAPLKKSLDEMKPELDKALATIKAQNEVYWTQLKSAH